MADLQPALLTMIGTTLGGVIASGAGLVQAKSQERIEQKRLDHEQSRLDHEREAAEAARRAADEAEREERERRALLGLGEAVRDAIRSNGTYGSIAEVRRLAYQVDDPVLHDLVEGLNYRDSPIMARAGYLLRKPSSAGRSDTAHAHLSSQDPSDDPPADA